MTVKLYIEQMEKVRGIANQDISIFEDTPIRDISKVRKQTAERIEDEVDMHQREVLLQIIEDCERTIKKYLYL